MKWNAKARKILERDGRLQQAVAREAGWGVGRFNNSLSAGKMPGAADGIALAFALGVRPEWLFDDRQGWPPPADPKDEIILALAERARRLQEQVDALAAQGGCLPREDSECRTGFGAPALAPLANGNPMKQG